MTSECLKIINENSKEICESPKFNEISKESLGKIVESGMLSCDEKVLFKAVDKWSESLNVEEITKNYHLRIKELLLVKLFLKFVLEQCSLKTWLHVQI